MLKIRLLGLAFAGLFLCLAPANAAGTIPFSFYPQVDLQGRVMPGCKFYTIQAGTVSTPQNAYQDSALTLPLPNPQTCDASGRLPQMFLADGSIKVRLTSSTGVAVLTADNVLVVGASSGGGGGGTVDPTTILATGDTKCRYGVGVLSGFVRRNGRTIGSATSGATERANSDTQALFEYLWGADPNLVVSTGRGASANADWTANKTITLPDQRGRVIAGLDDMGNSAAGRLTATYFGDGTGALGTVLGSVGGNEKQSLLVAQLPVFTPSGTVTSSWSQLTGTATNGQGTLGSIPGGPINYPSISGGSPVGGSLSVSVTGSVASSFAGTPIGGGGPHPVMSPAILETCYAKL